MSSSGVFRGLKFSNCGQEYWELFARKGVVLKFSSCLVGLLPNSNGFDLSLPERSRRVVEEMPRMLAEVRRGMQGCNVAMGGEL